MRTVARVMTPIRPSDPSTHSRRSGPAAEAGIRRYIESAGRRLNPSAGEHRFDAPVARRLLAGRSGRDPTAESRVVETLRIVAEHEALRAQLRFEIRPGHAGLECRELRKRIEVQETAQSSHDDGERRPPAGLGRQMADDAGRPADGNCHCANAARPGQNVPDFVLGFRKSDTVDNGADASETNAQPVFEALTQTRPQPRFRATVDEAMLGQPRGSHLGKDRSERRIAGRRRFTDAFAQEIARAVRQMRFDRLIAPAVPSPHPSTPSGASHMRAKRSALTVSRPGFSLPDAIAASPRRMPKTPAARAGASHIEPRRSSRSRMRRCSRTLLQ